MFSTTSSCICLGPKGSGKSHLLRALQEPETIDETTYSMSTNGTSIYKIVLPLKSNEVTPISTKPGGEEGKGQEINVNPEDLLKHITITEIGGGMSPIWRQYFNDVSKLIYVVDTSNLCQISAAGVLFYSILAEPRLQKVRILLVLSKMDYAYRQMRNEALLMLQMSKLQKEAKQSITIVEASAVNKLGFDEIYEWLRQP